MIFLTPIALLGLLALPAIWWLIRATPPPPVTRRFPSLLLLRRLTPTRQDTARAPLWLLLLRLGAAALCIIGLAQPVHAPPRAAAGVGGDKLIVVLDDGWAAVPHWADRLRALRSLGERSLRKGRDIVLLRSAKGPDGALPPAFTTKDAARFDDVVRHLRPRSWPVDRKALIERVHALGGERAHVLLISDGVASPDDAALRDALRALGPISDMRWTGCDVAVLGADAHDSAGLHLHLRALPCPATRHYTVNARNEAGGTLASQPVILPAHDTATDPTLSLPTILRNQTARLTLSASDGMGTATTTGPGTIRLLDEGDRRRPVGLLSTPNDDTPLIGRSFFLIRALGPIAELRRGTVNHLLGGPLSVLIAPDGTLASEKTRDAVASWVRKGGELIRFAGPSLTGKSDAPGQSGPTDAPDTALLPVPLLGNVRQLGGPMSWGKPQKLAPFPDDSPFAGLAVPAEVTVSRQVLARPSADLNDHVWARLTDGTPLVTARSSGKGEIVLFHVTPGADWSSLPLSGLFPDMLQRLIQRSIGLNAGAPATMLPPVEMLDADGQLVPPPTAARAIDAPAFDHTQPSADHPPGLYGPRAQRRALNIGDRLPDLAAEAMLGTPVAPAGAQADRPIGPWLIAFGVLLLLADLFLSLWRRGLLARSALALPVMLLALHTASAQAQRIPMGPTVGEASGSLASPEQVPPDVPRAALQTRLGYVLTGDEDVDQAARQGLQGLARYAADRTSAELGPPDGVHPGVDDLAFYPLIYWPVTPQTQPDPKRTAALNAFMAHGGILMIDTLGAGSDIDPGSEGAARAALRRATEGLNVPPLMKLDDHQILAHTFYLLHDFPGRVAGLPIWVARHGDENLDDVSPIIIGAADWAHAWAVDADGNTPYAVIPGGDEQRTTAYRFGVNVVIYALTGNYKVDQMKVPALLRRMGQ